ncbi:hypothetical protein Syun_012518 [Stephania yunnanensis]|uniref:non-specific serine/threonine protein kinase n=1 Tax=Stephania yunnanensis TaxID=152371 RepID=A0AAP0K0Y7_9MAGN
MSVFMAFPVEALEDQKFPRRRLYAKVLVPTEGLFQHTSAFSILGNSKLCGGISELQLPLCPADHKQKHSNKKHQISLHIKVVIGVVVSSTMLAALLLAVLSIIREGTEPVAVKVLNMIDHKASKSFMAECEALRDVRHRNLIKILNACSVVDFQGNDFKALIFKFMLNGSLENWLHPVRSDVRRYPTKSLNLPQRLNIAIDIASTMDYLHNHCETPIIHCDLKPSNILLDEDMVAHVGDFGLAKFLQIKNSNSSSTNNTSSFSPRGTIGYIPPGKRPTDEEFEDGLDLHQFCKIALQKGVMKIIDPHVLEHVEEEKEANDGHRDILANDFEIQRGTRHESGKIEECITSIIKVGVECSMPSASERMGIKDALKKLVAAKKLYTTKKQQISNGIRNGTYFRF